MRIQFITTLRGVSAIFVMISHIVFMFWYDKANLKSVFPYLQFDTMEAPFFIYSSFGKFLSFDFDIGAFGVASLFLVSGFVIPLSIEKTPGIRFLIMRIFRIYPTYIVGCAITFSVTFCYCYINHVAFPYSISHYFLQVSLISDWLFLPSIDGISWSLQAELKFYVLIFCLSYFRQINNSLVILGIAIIALLLGLWSCPRYELLSTFHPIVYVTAVIMNFSFIFLIYMCLGVCFYNLYKNYWSISRFLWILSLLYICFLWVSWNNNIIFFKTHALPYSAALLVFIGLYYKKEKICFNSKIINFIADISYPLFIVHGINSYMIMMSLGHVGVNPYLSMLIAIGLSISVSYCLYRWIDIPFHRYGKNIAGAFSR